MVLLLGIPHVIPLIQQIGISPPGKNAHPSARDRGLCCAGGVGKRGKNILVHALNILLMGKVLSCRRKN